MERVEWNEAYEVGHIDIDTEHKMFVRIIQKIQDAAANSDVINAKHLERLIEELMKYTEFHFYSEENIMFEIDYPDLLNHKHQHEKLLTDLRNLIFTFEMNRDDLAELVKFLTDWFIHHTTKEDRKLAECMQDLDQCD